MSQRGSGQAPPPADNGLERRYGYGRASDGGATDRDGGTTIGGPQNPTFGAADADLDPGELDRYLEDRAKLAASSTSRSSSSGPTDDRTPPPASRWSSPARRRRRDADRALPEERFADTYPPESDIDPLEIDVDKAQWDDPDLTDDLDTWATADFAMATSPPVQPQRARHRPARPRPTVTIPAVHVPRSVTQSDILHDPIALALLGTAALLAFVMALVTLTRVGDLPSVLVLREDAYGNPARWGSPESLWQLPLLATMVTLMNLILAARLSRYDRFASRFLLAAAVVVGIVAWVPAAHFLW